jgi:hypothetical protein
MDKVQKQESSKASYHFYQYNVDLLLNIIFGRSLMKQLNRHTRVIF